MRLPIALATALLLLATPAPAQDVTVTASDTEPFVLPEVHGVLVSVTPDSFGSPPGTPVQVATGVMQAAGEWLDTSISSGLEYGYSLKAVNVVGTSAPSEEETIVIPSPLEGASPTDFTALAVAVGLALREPGDRDR